MTHSPKQTGWYAELDKADQLRHIWRTDDEGEAELVAVVMGDSDDDYDPVPAQRAHLIAAAPELYEAADAVMPILAMIEEGFWDGCPFPDVQKRRIAALRAALSKARPSNKGEG